MNLGLTDGTNNAGLQIFNTGGTNYAASVSVNVYGLPVGSKQSDQLWRNETLGVTTEPTKSGIICENDLNIKYIIKY